MQLIKLMQLWRYTVRLSKQHSFQVSISVQISHGKPGLIDIEVSNRSKCQL